MLLDHPQGLDRVWIRLRFVGFGDLGVERSQLHFRDSPGLLDSLQFVTMSDQRGVRAVSR
jgi:hypothetical protein